MDLEHLTKHQIVLLTLLVSFMTSIATGIVTVALMNQAPPEVTRTINQVVQQTIEKVVPVNVTQSASAANAAQKTVIIRSDDLVVQSVSSVQKGIVRIVPKGENTLVARGVIITKNGTTLTDKTALETAGTDSFEAILQDGSRFPVSVHTGGATSSPIAVVDIAVGTSTGFTPVSLADTSKLGLGQSVIRIGGSGGDTVGQGVISAFSSGEGSNNPPTLVEASVSSATPGSLLMTLFGEIIAISTGESQAQGVDHYSIPMSSQPAPVTKPTS